MHGSGVEVGEALKQQFIQAQQTDDVGFLKIQIVDEAFKTTTQGARSDSRAEAFAEMAKVLNDREPCYLITRAEEKGRWQLVFFMPDECSVRDRMVYASSTNALKIGLGAPHFVMDYTIRTRQECTQQAYEDSRKEHNEEELMTMDERMAKEAAYESHMSRSTAPSKMSGMNDLPMKVSASVEPALEQIQVLGGATSMVIFNLEQSSEELQVAKSTQIDWKELVAELPAREPRYALLRYEHQHEDNAATSYVFVYYCPDSAAPKLKMFYSSCKSMVVKLCGVHVSKQIEISAPNEISEQVVLDELYPKAVASKAFAKPSRPGKARTTFAKFNAA